MRIAVVAAIAVSAVAAFASPDARACGSGSRSSCGHYRAADWTVAVELDAASHWLHAPLAEPHYGETLSIEDGTPPAVALGGRARVLIGGAPKIGYAWLYGGFEFEADRALSGPTLVDHTAVGALDVHTSWLLDVRFPIGVRKTVGPLQLTTELSPGMVGVTYGTRTGGDIGFGIDARAAAAVWLADGAVTLGIGVGIDVLDPWDRSVVLAWTTHYDRYDRPR